MVEVIRKIIINVLKALYQPFWYVLIMTVLVMFFYLSIKKHGWKVILREFWQEFKESNGFQRKCLLTFYIIMILFMTLFNRNIWAHPLENVIGVWGIYNANGELTTEAIENLVLFIPFVVLLLWNYHGKIIGEGAKILKTIWQSVKIVFLFSLLIEMLQLFLHVGTFQLSDLFYNTLGGFIGGFIYWFCYKFTHGKEK